MTLALVPINNDINNTANNLIYCTRRPTMNYLTVRLGLLMFVVYGLICLVTLLHKNFVW